MSNNTPGLKPTDSPHFSNGNNPFLFKKVNTFFGFQEEKKGFHTKRYCFLFEWQVFFIHIVSLE
ncbi:MAG: hypothetical protein EA363_06925 [Balneolaceae bacterium]|nr:MAG: hypothetical protein EA363_06925 [Balneolaceae bacterium]